MLLEIIALLFAIPVGFLISWLARDELIIGRRWFSWLIFLSLVAVVYFTITGQKPIAETSGFILIASLISYIKSFDKSWTGQQ